MSAFDQQSDDSDDESKVSDYIVPSADSDSDGKEDLRAQIGDILRYLQRLDSLKDELKGKHEKHSEFLLSKLKDIADEIQQKSSDLYFNCEVELFATDRDKLSVDDNDTHGNDALIPRDPFYRNIKTPTNNKKRYLVACGPFRPELKSYPVNTTIPIR